MRELEHLIKRVIRLSPAYQANLGVPSEMQDTIGENVQAVLEAVGGSSILSRFQKLLPGELLDMDTLKGMWMMLKFTGEYQADVFKRRLRGEYETDEWGMDQEFIDAILPLFDFMYHKYWRVDMQGLENIPEEGRALLVSNHSGQLPFDGAMLLLGILQQHTSARFMRALYASWFPTLPFLSDLLTKVGQVMANDENAQRLLEQDQLVAVYPEATKASANSTKTVTISRALDAAALSASPSKPKHRSFPSLSSVPKRPTSHCTSPPPSPNSSAFPISPSHPPFPYSDRRV